MKTLEILGGILFGAVAITWLLWLAVRIIRNGRDLADRNRRIYDNESRYRYPKGGRE